MKGEALKRNSYAKTQDKHVCWPETHRSGAKAISLLDSRSGSLLKQTGVIIQENGKSQEPELLNVKEL